MTAQTPENYTNDQPITETEFVELYGNNQVAITGLPPTITVNFALAMEATHCPADAEKRTDETARLHKLAGYVGCEALRPEHRWLLSTNKNL